MLHAFPEYFNTVSSANGKSSVNLSPREKSKYTIQGKGRGLKCQIPQRKTNEGGEEGYKILTRGRILNQTQVISSNCWTKSVSSSS